jgi:integrase
MSITGGGRRLSYYDEFAVGKGNRRQPRCKDAAAAEELARELVQQAARTQGLAVASGSTWADLCQAWVDAHDGKLPEGTFRRRFSAINAWLVPIVGSVEVTTTDLATLLAVADRLVAADTGISNFESVTQSMNVVAKWGRARRWLPPDPLGADSDREYQLKRLRDQLLERTKDKGVRMDQVPTWEEVCEWADAVEKRVAAIAGDDEVGAQFGRAIRICAGTGLRMTELLGLTAADIDLKQGVVSVTKQLDRYTRWETDQPMPTAPPKHRRNHVAVAWAKVEDDLKAAVAFVGGGDAPPVRPLPGPGVVRRRLGHRAAHDPRGNRVAVAAALPPPPLRLVLGVTP